MTYINRKRYIEIGAECKLGISDSVELVVKGRRYTGHNIITNSALTGLRTRTISQYIAFLGLIRKPNAGWAPAAGDTEESYADAHYSINCGDEPPGVPDPVDMQDSWVESWTNNITGSVISWGPSYSYIEIEVTFLFGALAQSPLWNSSLIVTSGGNPSWGRGGTYVLFGGSNETGLGGCDKSGHLNGACLGNEDGRKINGIVIASTVSRENAPYDAGLGYQPAPFHQITYLWSAAQLLDELGSPVWIDLDPDEGGYEQFRLIYKLRIHIPDPVEETVGGYSITTTPYAGVSAVASESRWHPWTFPSVGGGCGVQEEQTTPDFIGLLGGVSPVEPGSKSLVGTADYYREWTYRWEPAYANYATGVGRIVHGSWVSPNTSVLKAAFVTVLNDKALKTDHDKLVFNVRYSWART